MKIAIVGYGKMGKIIDEIAQQRGHTIVARLSETPTLQTLNGAEVAIEFSLPAVAYDNIKSCLSHAIPVICGTTGWLDQKPEIEQFAIENNTAFLYGSNFSLGVQLFFNLNQKLAQLLRPYPEYQCHIEEIHHIHKKDAPSGTAISLAEGIVHQSDVYNEWHLDKTMGQNLGITAKRESEVPGTHIVSFTSLEDEIQIKHTAFNRRGFALGAVIAAEWILNKKGIFSMNDVLGL